METLGPIQTRELFPGERAALLDLLGGLSSEEWTKPTVCSGWTVHDLVLHLLWGDLSYLSRHRDEFSGFGPNPAGDLSDWGTLVSFINDLNERWVRSARRVSPRLAIDLLRLTGGQLAEFLATLDLEAGGGPVSWAGSGQAPVWLDVAREYTERWIHQQQIRDAVAKPGLTEREWCHPVLDAFARAIPHALRERRPPDGTRVALEITGEAGDVWLAERQSGTWRLGRGPLDDAAARVTLDQDTAWRLFTRGVPPEQAAERTGIEGDPDLAVCLLRMVTIIA